MELCELCVRATNKNRPPLLAATTNNHFKCVQYLLQAGADVNILDCLNWTALIHAAKNGYTKCMECLLQGGADVNRFTSYDWKPLWVSSCGYDSECTEFTTGVVNWTSLQFASAAGHVNCVKLLLEYGADVNLKDVANGTALMYAAQNSYSEYCKPVITQEDDLHSHCIELLIKAGANVNDINSYGNTALILGSHSQRCVKLLLRAGAHVNIVNRKGENALESLIINYGKKSLQPECFKHLLASGEIVNETKTKIKENIPDFIMELKAQICLKNMCRESIRKQLMSLNLHSHLFYRIPHLGLPSIVTSYLLYDLTLDDDVKEDYM